MHNVFFLFNLIINGFSTLQQVLLTRIFTTFAIKVNLMSEIRPDMHIKFHLYKIRKINIIKTRGKTPFLIGGKTPFRYEKLEARSEKLEASNHITPKQQSVFPLNYTIN